MMRFLPQSKVLSFSVQLLNFTPVFLLLTEKSVIKLFFVFWFCKIDENIPVSILPIKFNYESFQFHLFFLNIALTMIDIIIQ